MDKLETKYVKEFPGGAVGSLVVDNYIYVLSDYLYRCSLDGDTIGDAVAMSDIISPQSIASNGTVIYVGHVDSDGKTRLSVLPVANYMLLTTTAVLDATTGYWIGKMVCDGLGFLHLVWRPNNISASRWRIYSYDTGSNQLNLSKEINVGAYTRSIATAGGYFLLIGNFDTNKTHLYTWDGTTEKLLSDTYGEVYTAISDYEDKFVCIERNSPDYNWHHLGVDANEEVEQLNSILFSATNKDIYVLVSDGRFLYAMDSLNATVYVVEIVNNEFQQRPNVAAAAAIASGSPIYTKPNTIHCANNRIYVSTGDCVYVMRWIQKAAFTPSAVSGEAPLTITFTAETD